MRNLFAAVLMVLAGCSGTAVTNSKLDVVSPSTPVRWRVNAECMASEPLDGVPDREKLARDCRDNPAREFVALALSGGGAKAAIFSGEAMFYLQALGLLQRTDVISSVSGGSFAGALYALSCDPGDEACTERSRPGLTRPLWKHDNTMHTLGTGYGSLVNEQVVRFIVPGFGASISANRFADVIDRDYLGRAPGSDARFTFSDLNPRRPHLFLNATILSHNRGGLESVGRNGCPSIGNRGYLRRRTPDEYFHFAFSDFYFGLLKSSIADYPVAAGVAASAAFPALIDNATLIDHCRGGGKAEGIRLMDGGANDNQALIEVYLILSELALGEARSDLSVEHKELLERLDEKNRAWFIVVNSSVTESTGLSSSVTDDVPRSALGLLLGVYDKVTNTTDTYSAIGYDLRKQLYLANGERLRLLPKVPAVLPMDISLTSLDQYAIGGAEAALRTKSGIGYEATDIAAARMTPRIARQRKAYSKIVENPEVRKQLGLEHWHPQCYFDMRGRLDASLAGLNEDDQACLREAARWSVALRSQEMCDGKVGKRPPDGLDCSRDVVGLREPQAISGHMGGVCHPTLPAPPRPEDVPPDPRVVCRDLGL